MYEFAQEHPEVELRFAAGLRIADFDRDEVDVAIRFSVDAPKDLHSEPLIDEWLTPMMTPALAAQIETPADLVNHTLIHDDSIAFVPQPCDWVAWARESGTALDTDHGGACFACDARVRIGAFGRAVQARTNHQSQIPLRLPERA